MRYDPKQVFTSPAGPASFPNLNKPRQYRNKGVFSYDTGLILSDAQFTKAADEKGRPYVRGLPEGVSFEQALSMWGALSVEKSRLEPRPLPFGPLLEKDSDGNRVPVPGFTVVKFKVDAETTTRKGDVWDRKPKLFDIDGNPITTPFTVTGGTIIRVKFTVWLTTGGNNAGVKLQPVSVQIIKAVDNSESFERYEGGEYEDDATSFSPAGDSSETKGDF